jgi:eukaryotic-like serine/threonine-protein kinase
MALAAGTRFGPYEIAEPIGAGGMGEVYRATDTTLERDVAIKVLPASFASDAGRVERFEREAKTLASLNHPNIAQIYGLERSDGTTALVMELVEGPTLEDRIANGPLPADEALGIAMQIADALEAAHSQNIVHRDLKPANIKLKPDGTVKVLDFGIAKALAPENLVTGPQSPVMTTPATQVGVILGTAAYMSPEQAKGKAVDQRTDIWAFGCLLYEMLTGQLAFGAEDVPTTLARVIANDTNLDSLPAAISPAVRKTIELCLQKDVRKRVRDIGDVKLALAGAFASDSPRTAAVAATRPFWRRALPIAAAVFLTGAVVSFAAWSLRPAPVPRPLNRFEYQLPTGQIFPAVTRSVIAFSRDGRSIAYSTPTGIYLRRMDALDGRLIPGTEGSGAGLSFSPDGQSIAYVTQSSEVRRIGIDGGSSVVVSALIAANAGDAATWELDGAILYAAPGGIYRVSANGGRPELIIPAESPERFSGPQLLPDGDSVLFSATRSVNWDNGEIVVQSLATGERKTLVSGASGARFVAPGYLVYEFGNGLLGVAFDPVTRSVFGAGVPLVQGVLRAPAPANSMNFGVSSDGTLVYAAAQGPANARTLVWVDRAGHEEPIDAPPRAYTSPRLSPDGTKLLLNARDEELDIWTWDLARETLTRLTFDPGQDRSPVWSPDGRRVAYSTQQGRAAGDFNTAVAWQAADGTGVAEQIVASARQLFPTAFLPDGSGILVYGDSGNQIDDVTLVRLEGDNRLTPVLAAPAYSERTADLSPDGRWVAYESDESGRSDIYVRPFPDVDAGRWQVSTNGGTEPRWSRDGRELFYRSGTAFMVAAVETTPTFAAGNPEILFEDRYFGSGGGVPLGGRAYDVSPDGKRFVMIKPVETAAAAPRIVIVENWIEELERLVPTSK